MLVYLSTHDYTGKFLKKPAGPIGDGAAIFWKVSCFDLVDCLEISKVSTWNQVCLCVQLETKNESEPRRIAVASTHLKAYQTVTEENTRVKQALAFTELLDTWADTHNATLRLFVGDMNSSRLGKVLSSLESVEYFSAYHKFDWTKKGSNLFGNPLSIFKMVSFCMGGEKGLYDYIFYKKKQQTNVEIVDCDELQHDSLMTTIGGKSFPSDHLPVYAKIKFW